MKKILFHTKKPSEIVRGFKLQFGSAVEAGSLTLSDPAEPPSSGPIFCFFRSLGDIPPLEMGPMVPPGLLPPRPSASPSLSLLDDDDEELLSLPDEELDDELLLELLASGTVLSPLASIASARFKQKE